MCLPSCNVLALVVRKLIFFPSFSQTLSKTCKRILAKNADLLEITMMFQLRQICLLNLFNLNLTVYFTTTFTESIPRICINLTLGFWTILFLDCWFTHIIFLKRYEMNETNFCKIQVKISFVNEKIREMTDGNFFQSAIYWYFTFELKINKQNRKRLVQI